MTRTVLVRRAYPAQVGDVCDACTTAERIGRWLMPVTADLRPARMRRVSPETQ